MSDDVFRVIELVDVEVKMVDLHNLGTVPLDTGDPLIHAVVEMRVGELPQAACGTAKRRVAPTFWLWSDPKNDRMPRCQACVALFPLD
jgi:hypothetical protein